MKRIDISLKNTAKFSSLKSKLIKVVNTAVFKIVLQWLWQNEWQNHPKIKLHSL